MNESFVTVVGNVVGDPQGRSTRAGKPFATFRVASTTRRWDTESRSFVDGSTNFVNVVAFNALGGNIMASLRKGQPVLVYGRLRVNQWVNSEGVNMTSVEVDAYSVGHDLSRGQTAFSRPERVQYESNDRLADPNIQESFDEPAGEGDAAEALAQLSAGALTEQQDGSADGRRTAGASFGRTPEDAETDDYVVVGAG